MAENINKRPAKSILKSSASQERRRPDGEDQDRHASTSKRAKEQRFDEMNILATLHPPGKDYGHMKIDEPKTPYSEYAPGEDDEPGFRPPDEVDARLLAAKLAASLKEPPPPVEDTEDNEDDEDEEEEDAEETPEERQLRVQFEAKRKKHYNEFQAIMMARKLMEEDDEEEEGEPVSDAKAAEDEGASAP